MGDINSLIDQVRASNLSKREKDWLVKRIVKEGPGFDLLSAVNEIKAGGQSDGASLEGKVKAVSFIIVIAGLFFLFSDVFKVPKPTPPSPIVMAPKDIGEAGRSITEKEDRRNVVSISAKELYRDFDSNEIAAEKIYKDALLEVTGTIDDIGRSISNTPFLVLETEGAFGVQCFFDEKNAERLVYLQRGQYVEVEGRVTGKFANVFMEQCKLR